MIHMRSLENEAIANIHSVFTDAFSEYQVKIDMPIEKLTEMMITRSYSKRLSMGCYEEDKLVGFTLVGFRETKNGKECYDIATGIIKSHQNKGLGDKILKQLLVELSSADINCFSLEVLENNTAAQRVYSNNGFKISRKLCCYEKKSIIGKINDTEVTKEEGLSSDDEGEYCSFAPSWQNSLTAYMNFKEKYHIEVMRDVKQTVRGYGIIHRETGSILQIGSKQCDEREKIVEEILEKMYTSVAKEKYTLS